MKLSEDEVRNFIAKYPWLLNLDYEIVRSLPNEGKEFTLPNGNRIDLLLKDKRTKRPVVVEFKSFNHKTGSTSRKTIGQVLDYKTKVIMELHQDNSTLYQIYGELVACPVLILIVPSCDDKFKIACHLQGIDVYTYDTLTDTSFNVENLSSLDETIKNLKQPLVNTRRWEEIDKIDKELYSLMEKNQLDNHYQKFKYPPGFYYYALANFFINKNLFPNKKVCIGIYEDIFREEYDKICFEYFSGSEETRNIFIEKLKKKFPRSEYKSIETDTQYNEYTAYFYLDKESFIGDVKQIDVYIKDYVAVMEEAFGEKF